MKVTVERLTPLSLALDLVRNTMGKEERPMERSTNALAELARPLEDTGDFEDTDRR